MTVEKFAGAVFANSYDKFISTSGKRDHHKFSSLIKDTLTSKKLKEEMKAKMQAEAEAKMKAEAEAKASTSRRTWGF